MRAFEYASPATKEQAVGLLSANQGEIEILAGGTDLLSLMKDNVAAPSRLVNIKEIEGLDRIGFSRRGDLMIGALVTLQQLIDSAQVRRQFAALTEAAEGISSPQIRSLGTIGGNLCQRPRCWYYRAGFGLLARDEKGEPLVPAGDNRYHAILGNGGPAYFVNPSGLAPALIALGAKARVFGPNGEREVMIEKFFVTPRSEGELEYDLKPNEMITEIVLPAPSMMRSATYEVRQKEALDWPLASAAVSLKMSGNEVQSARVVMGYVAPVPWRSTEAEALLVGKKITEEVAQAAGNIAVSRAKSLGRNGYKIQLARVAVKRAILEAAKGGR